METIDRYLSVVKQYLPEALQDDVIRELSDDIRSRQDARESTLGRTLKEVELEGLLRQMGHPMALAGRYLPRTRLIGEVVYPYYWYSLKFALWCTTLLYILAACTTPFVAGLLAAQGKQVAPVLLSWPGIWVLLGGLVAMLTVVGAVTLVFAVLDSLQSHRGILDRWEPRGRIPVPQIPAEFLGRPLSRPGTIVLASLTAIFAFGWVAFPNFPMIAVPGTGITPAPGWQTFRTVMLAMMVASAIGGTIGLLRPLWSQGVWPVVHAVRIAGLFWMYLYASSTPLVTGSQPLAQVVSSAIAYGVLLCLSFTLLNSAITAFRWVARFLSKPAIVAQQHSS